MVVVALAMVAVAVATFGLPAYASSTQPDSVPGDVQVAPQSDEDGDSELPWLFAVFAVTWAAFFGYTFVMSRRQREMRREIEILQKTLQEKENKALAAESETEPPGSPTEG
jgi:CcmD family protein